MAALRGTTGGTLRTFLSARLRVLRPVTIGLRGRTGGTLGTTLSARLSVTSTSAPDLTVSTPTKNVSGNLTPGQTFTLTAVVTNDGNANSARTTLQWRRSTNATISTSDTQEGTDTVSALSPNGTSTETFSLAAPSTPGTYYYGATVDSVTNESNTRNNNSGALRVVVGTAQTAPAFSDNTGNSQSWTVGTAISTLTVPRASGDPTPIYEVVGSLPNGISFNASNRRLTGRPTTADSGTIRIRASNAEGSADWTVAYSITGTPDLVVSTPTRSPSGNLAPGQSFTLRAVVTNNGTGNAAGTTLRWRSSTNDVISTSDTQVGTDSVSQLDPNRTSIETLTLAAPSTLGTYYYGATVDNVAGESTTTNNASGALTVRVVADAPDTVALRGTTGGTLSTSLSATLSVTSQTGGPDLVVSTLTLVPDVLVIIGETFTLQAVVTNNGNERSASTTLRWYGPTSLNAGNMQIGTDSVGALAPGETSVETFTLDAPSMPLLYYYEARVDSVANESDTGNNTSGLLPVRIFGPTTGGPDLVVGIPTRTPAGSLTPGQRFTLRIVVTNQGDATAASTTLEWYRTTNAHSITTIATLIGTDSIPGLATGRASVETLTLSAPATPGTYYYGATVDAVADETNTNNDSLIETVRVATADTTAPDLVVSTPTRSPTGDLTAGQSFTLTAEVTNQGDADSASTTLRWRSSTNALISNSDTLIGTDAVGALAPNETSIQTLTLTATLGTHYYGVTVDPVADEYPTTNNNSGALTVVLGTGTDAPVFADNTGDAQSWTVGTSISTLTVPAAIGNPPPTYAVVDSLPDGISFSPSSRRLTGRPTEDGSGTITIRATNSEGSDDWTVGYAVGGTGDVTVSTPTRNPSGNLAPGQSFTLTTVVTNAGSGTSDATTVRWRRSTNNSINTGDTQIGTDAVSKLAPSGTSTESLTLTAPTTPGTYYYGATVDSISREVNTGNNNSGAVTVRVVALEAPSFVASSGDAQAWVIGTAVSVLTVPRASGNPTPTYSASGLPSGVGFNSSTRRISGTPSGSPQSGTITITASNNQGSDTYTIEWSTVRAPGSTISLIGSAGGTFATTLSATLLVASPFELVGAAGGTLVTELSAELTVAVPTIGITVMLPWNISFANFGHIWSRTSGSPSLGSTLSDDGMERFLRAVYLPASTSEVTSSAIHLDISTNADSDTNAEFSTQMESTGVITFSSGTKSVSITGLQDTTEPYRWDLSGRELRSFRAFANAAAGSDLTIKFFLPPLIALVGTANRTLTTTLGAELTVATPLKTVALIGTGAGTSDIDLGATLTVTTPLKTVALIGTGPGARETTLNAELTVTTPLKTVGLVGTGGDTLTTQVSATLTVTLGLKQPSFADDAGDAQYWTIDTAIAAITVPPAAGNPVPTYAAVGALPAGVVFNTGTRVISGTPTQEGSGTITVRATNPEGSDDWTVAYSTVAGLGIGDWDGSGYRTPIVLALVPVTIALPDITSQDFTPIGTADIVVASDMSIGQVERHTSPTLRLRRTTSSTALFSKYFGDSPAVYGQAELFLVIRNAVNVSVTVPFSISNTGGGFSNWQIDANSQASLLTGLQTGDRFVLAMAEPLETLALVGTAGGTLETTLSAELTVATGLKTVGLVGTGGGTFTPDLGVTLTVGVAEGLVGTAGGTLETTLSATLSINASQGIVLVGTAGGTLETTLNATLGEASPGIVLVGTAGGTLVTELRVVLGDVLAGMYSLEVWVWGPSSVSAQLGVKIGSAMPTLGSAVALNGDWQRLTYKFSLSGITEWQYGLRFSPTARFEGEDDQTVYVGGWRLESGNISNYVDRSYPGANLSGDARPSGLLRGTPGGTFTTTLNGRLTVR